LIFSPSIPKKKFECPSARRETKHHARFSGEGKKNAHHLSSPLRRLSIKKEEKGGIHPKIAVEKGSKKKRPSGCLFHDFNKKG